MHNCYKNTFVIHCYYTEIVSHCEIQKICDNLRRVIDKIVNTFDQIDIFYINCSFILITINTIININKKDFIDDVTIIFDIFAVLITKSKFH